MINFKFPGFVGWGWFTLQIFLIIDGQTHGNWYRKGLYKTFKHLRTKKKDDVSTFQCFVYSYPTFCTKGF